MAEHLNMPEAELRRKYIRKVGRRFSLKEHKPGRDCVFLQAAGDGGRKCAVYPVRPAQCRTWPFWQQNLADPEAWARAGLRCKGINRGRTYGFEEIERICNATT